MDVTYIDSEPPHPIGGGIRTYFRLAMAACREHGVTTRIYTHSPEAYPGETTIPIGREPWLPYPWRGMAYRWAAGENALWEHSRWLEKELSRTDRPGRVYEFCDFLGYTFFTMRNQALQTRCIVRIHTPNFLVSEESYSNGSFLSLRRLRQKLADASCRRRESACLARTQRLTVPSPQFVAEKLPTLKNWVHIPNPVPPLTEPGQNPGSAPDRNPDSTLGQVSELAPVQTNTDELRILCLGRVEPRKGTLDLVKAFLEFSRTHPNASLTLVGSEGQAEYSHAVRTAMHAAPLGIRNRITWEPPCAPERRIALFRRFNVLAVPSRWENSPYVYFEGMAAGLLCLGSATGEMKSVASITKAPLANSGDVSDWVRALESVASGVSWESIPLQTEYIRNRRQEIPRQMIDYYRKVAAG